MVFAKGEGAEGAEDAGYFHAENAEQRKTKILKLYWLTLLLSDLCVR